MKIEYVACDGTRFDNQRDCELHEEEIVNEFIKEKRLAFLGAKENPLSASNIGSSRIPLLPFNENVKALYRNCIAIYIGDKEVLDYVKTNFSQIDDINDSNCFYFWNGSDWIHENVIKNQCQSTLSAIEDFDAYWVRKEQKKDQSVNLSKIWNGIDPTLKDELMIDEDGIVYPF